jgi:hypothetical protein
MDERPQTENRKGTPMPATKLQTLRTSGLKQELLELAAARRAENDRD